MDILKIAKQFAAHADSTLCIRGNDDIVAFAQAVLAEAQPKPVAMPTDEQVDTLAGMPIITNPAEIEAAFEKDDAA